VEVAVTCGGTLVFVVRSPDQSIAVGFTGVDALFDKRCDLDVDRAIDQGDLEALRTGIGPRRGSGEGEP
jgi:hypothetical protein